MATLIRSDLVVHLPIEQYEAQVIAANRRLAELGILRCDYRKAPDGMRRFIAAVHRMESQA